MTSHPARRGAALRQKTCLLLVLIIAGSAFSAGQHGEVSAWVGTLGVCADGGEGIAGSCCPHPSTDRAN
jgi:hypothetical protein